MNDSDGNADSTRGTAQATALRAGMEKAMSLVTGVRQFATALCYREADGLTNGGYPNPAAPPVIEEREMHEAAA